MFMPPRNHKSWLSVPPVEAVSSEIYSSQEIYEQEIKNIFAKVWVPVIHKSEIRNEGDYRTSQIAFQNIIIVNAGDRVKAYRIYDSQYQVSGKLKAPIVTSEPELYCEVKHGGMVWVTLDPNPSMSVEEWTAGAFDCIARCN